MVDQLICSNQSKNQIVPLSTCMFWAVTEAALSDNKNETISATDSTLVAAVKEVRA